MVGEPLYQKVPQKLHVAFQCPFEICFPCLIYVSYTIDFSFSLVFRLGIVEVSSKTIGDEILLLKIATILISVKTYKYIIFTFYHI